MTHKAVTAVRQARKHKHAVKVGKKIKEEDLLPESREFLEPQVEGKIIYKNMPMSENEDKYKRMIMWSGITFFMVLIFIVWGYNLKNNFKLNIGSANGNQSWGDISKELDKAMSTIEESADKLSQLAAENQATSTATTTDETYNMASIVELKNVLESASTTAATTTVKTKIKK